MVETGSPFDPVGQERPEGLEGAEAWPPLGYEAFCLEFAQQARAKRLHHGWVLAGPSGIGKAKLARWLAAWLIAGHADRPEESSLFGGEADSEAATQEDIFAGLAQSVDAHQVLQGVHPDFLMITAEVSEKNKSGQIKIEQIRQMGRFASQTSGRGGWRVMIVDDMEAVNRNGANAMLKILEEPPEKTVIFLLSGQPDNLMPTIRSRVSVARLPVLSADLVARICASQRPELTQADLSQIVPLALGAPGRVLELVDSGVVGLYLESCALIAMPKPSETQAQMLANSWGPGGAKGAPIRRQAVFLFDQLLHGAALRALGHTPDEGPDEGLDKSKHEVIIAAEKQLAARHGPAKLAELHQKTLSQMQRAEALYLDFPAIMGQIFHALCNR